MAQDRQRNLSPFPSAYKLLCDIENDKEPTLKIEITEELRIASERIKGVWCQKCGLQHETGLNWVMDTILEIDSPPTYIWTCVSCQEAKHATRGTEYFLKGKVLDSSIEDIKLPSKLPSGHRRIKFPK